MVEKRKHADGSGEPPAPVAKRQRVSRACDQCRAAREKCDGIQPMCFTCASSNRACSYTTPPKKRGIQPGYIRTLELTLAWVLENTTGAENKLRAALAQESVASVLSGKDTDGSHKLHKTWRRNSAFKELERLLGKSEHASTPERESPDEPTSNVDPGSANPGISPPASDGSFTANLPPHLWRLLDVYYAYTHTWFPILQKHDMLKLAYAYGDGGLRLTPGVEPEHAELWALLAVASVQDDAVASVHDDVVASVSISDRTSKRIYDTARRLIPDERGKLSISHVKALLLLTLINIGSEYWTGAWLLLGQAINVAVDLGLQNPIPSQLDYDRRKHVILACFLLESLISSHLDRAPRLASLDVASLGPVEEEGLEEWHPWTPCDGFGEHRATARDSTASLSRTPSHSLSIFNQLLVLSNSVRGPSTTLTVNLPSHLRLTDSRESTPQLLYLHVAHACITGASDRAQQLFAAFAQQFGIVAMPPISHLYASLLGKQGIPSVSNLGILNKLLFNLAKVWGATADATDPIQEEPETVSPNIQTNFITVPNVTESSPLYTNAISMDRRAPTVVNLAQQRSSLQVPKADEGQSFQRYNSHSSVDLDALFDELASLDGTDNADNQPLFMQNLGLAPNVDLNDVLASDFGFDPLLSTYMSGAPIASNRSRNYPNG
ncbi:hypothetical protein NA57DRAFT_76720 [Rhizodiscina lignyota]|uniref:Zn(2)-C6 fungal-type domain-containing protein n=1 Tax=Rhizodiscina lignyota TaxID=1504668 RepID=A0A9P4IER4_9PEZI|nr:hypothetical protein NA57DRAFT_76720 [Rhizodiscina lignyota]